MTNPTVTAVDEIRAAYDREVALTRSMYSDLSKFTPNYLKGLLAEVYLDAKNAIAEAANTINANAITRRAQLERTLFGIQPGEDIVAFRDATDRVAALKDKAVSDGKNVTEAYREASNAAVASGDTGIARALAKLGYETGIPQLVSNYVENAPTTWGLMRAVTEMNTLPSANPTTALRDALLNGGKAQIVKPAEIDGLDDYAIEALAKTAGT